MTTFRNTGACVEYISANFRLFALLFSQICGKDSPFSLALPISPCVKLDDLS